MSSDGGGSSIAGAIRLITFGLVCLTLNACSSLPAEIEPLPPQASLPPAAEGRLAELESSIARTYPSDQSGFRLLDVNADALTWRLALADEAVSSLDLMYYLWYGDDSGRLLLRRVIQAADRGVRVRLIVDDLLLLGADKTLVALESHPNIQVRLFNPWKHRRLGRGVEFLARMRRLNSRMHDKLMIADNHAVILGGRNIGDHYFGLSHAYNFHDLDVLGVGPVARQASGMFDHFWNSSWVVSSAELPAEIDEQEIAERTRRFVQELKSSQSLKELPVEPQDWTDQLQQLSEELRFGTSTFVYDKLEEGEIVMRMADPLGDLLKSAEREILLVNAYIVPDQSFVDRMKELTDKGVRVRILTNSLASHDVPAVNSHYEKWRKPFIEAGAELHELRADAAIKPFVDTRPVESKFVGLHTKAFVVDRRKVFVGSMNFDPRSVNINTEMGVTIESAALGEDLARLAERDMGGENAWKVELDDQGKLIWVNSDETVTRQPARHLWQRIMDGLFKLLPKSQA